MPDRPQVIQGKWKKRIYRIVAELGRGTGGVVYHVLHSGRSYALKVGHDPYALTSEVNVLKMLQKAQGSVLGPSLYDVDDWASPEGVRPFYVMNMVQGVRLDRFVREKGEEWLAPLVLDLLSFLEEVHKRGYVFGDLKPEHLLVSGQPPRLAWFDAGGFTRLGRAVKEYTELYDRGFWRMGDRKAEPAYDLFSTALIILHVARGKPVQAGEPPLPFFLQKVNETPSLQPYREVLQRAFLGQYPSARQMKEEWRAAWVRATRSRGYTPRWKRDRDRKAPLAASSIRSPASPRRKGSRFVRVIKFAFYLFFSSFLALLIALYLMYQAL